MSLQTTSTPTRELQTWQNIWYELANNNVHSDTPSTLRQQGPISAWLAKKASCSELAPAHLKEMTRTRFWRQKRPQIWKPFLASNLKPCLASTIEKWERQAQKLKPKLASKSDPFQRKEFWMLGFIHFTSAKGKLLQMIAFSEAFSFTILHKPLAMTLIAHHALCRT